LKLILLLPQETAVKLVTLARQVCVQLLTSAVNVALPAFAAARPASAPPAVQQLIRPGPWQQTRRTLLPAACERDRQTDGRMDGHRIVT